MDREQREAARGYVREARQRERTNDYGPAAGRGKASESDDITMLCEDLDAALDHIEAQERRIEELQRENAWLTDKVDDLVTKSVWAKYPPNECPPDRKNL